MTKQELIETLQALGCSDDTPIELWNSNYHTDTFTSLNDIELADYSDGTQAIQLSY